MMPKKRVPCSPKDVLRSIVTLSVVGYESNSFTDGVSDIPSSAFRHMHLLPINSTVR